MDPYGTSDVKFNISEFESSISTFCFQFNEYLSITLTDNPFNAYY